MEERQNGQENSQNKSGTEYPPSKKPGFFDRVKDYLYYRSSDEDTLNTMQTLQVAMMQDSTMSHRAIEGSAAYDLYAHKKAIIKSQSLGLVPVNLRIAITPWHFLLLLLSSGLALKGITILGGVIDSDFHGEIQAILLNTSDTEFSIQKGQRIWRGVFLPTTTEEFKITKALEENGNHIGFGSTGTM